MAHSLKVEVKPIDVRWAAAIERAVEAIASSTNGGMITGVSAASLNHKELIIKLAMRHRLPVVYAYRIFVTSGGLMSYATDIIAQYKRVAGYVDRILKGEKPADLPVQEPTKLRTSNQFAGCKGHWARCPANPTRSCRRGDRVTARCRLKPLGHTKRNDEFPLFGSKADIAICLNHPRRDSARSIEVCSACPPTP